MKTKKSHKNVPKNNLLFEKKKSWILFFSWKQTLSVVTQNALEKLRNDAFCWIAMTLINFTSYTRPTHTHYNIYIKYDN